MCIYVCKCTHGYIYDQRSLTFVFFLSSTACGLRGCWLLLGCLGRLRGVFRAPFIAALLGLCLSWVGFLLAWFVAFSWLASWFTICIACGFRLPNLSHHLPSPRVLPPFVVGLACRRICMSDEAIRELATAITRLASAIEGQQTAGPVPLSSLSTSAAADYEIVCVYPPSLPVDPDTWTSYTRSQVFRTVEEGPPEIPGFCWNLGFQNLGTDKDILSTKLSSAFSAGFWARAAVDCAIPYSRRDNPYPSEIIRHYVVLRSSQPHPFRVTCWQDLADICDVTDRLLVFESFATFTEVQVFCAGSRWEIPALKRWRKRS